MDIILQIWGGGFYLLNKIFFALAEGKKEKTKRHLKIIGWITYIRSSSLGNYSHQQA